jgi:diketogulonate reductase-like aldo/keto reductase
VSATGQPGGSLVVQGVEVPTFLYGTAWKEERSEGLVRQALAAGFRGIDTANQRRHYHEAGVGAALAEALAAGELSREALFLQTKYTYREGQDHRLPYDPAADYPTQVRQSFESSLEHLGVEHIDSYLLHGPRTRRGLSEADLQVWRAMEELHREGRARLLGISNVNAEQVATLCEIAAIKPAFVQNRCFARQGWDREVRAVCRREGVVYQGFSLLTANQAELASRTMREIATRHGRTVPQVVFRFALQVGMICLTGTTDPEHMRDDLAVYEFVLTERDAEAIERLSG